MKKVRVEAVNGSYDIEIGRGILSAKAVDAKKVAVVTDETVWNLHGRLFEGAEAVVLPPGEQSKSMDTLVHLYDSFMRMNLDRGSVVVAFGGGVVGDIAGFAAATFKRGVRLLQAPTTLLAQVDSSVGGKTAINLPGGKNMVGTFYQPEKVVVDTALLDTLDKRQLAAGRAEVIKYSYIYDADMHGKLIAGNYPLEDAVARSCEIKADYVKRDPFDRGVRMQLNYGHTIGHAIETAAGYGAYLHGEAVAIGMAYAAALGERLGVSPEGLAADTRRMLEQYGLPYEAEKSVLEAAADILSADKKAENGEISFVLLDRIGHAVLRKLRVEMVKEFIMGANL